MLPTAVQLTVTSLTHVQTPTHVPPRSSYLGVTLVHDIAAFRDAAGSSGSRSSCDSTNTDGNGNGNGNGHGSCGGNGHPVGGGDGNATSAHGGNGGDTGAAGNGNGAAAGSCTQPPHHGHGSGNVYGADLPGKSVPGLLVPGFTHAQPALFPRSAYQF